MSTTARLDIPVKWPTEIALQARDGPYRDIGHVILPRLTLAGHPAAYGVLGATLIGMARQAARRGELLTAVRMLPFEGSDIAGFLFHSWRGDYDGCETADLADSGPVEVPIAVDALAPLIDFPLPDPALPLVGLVGERSGFPQQYFRRPEERLLYIAAPCRGLLEFGKVIAACAQDPEFEFAQFEHSTHAPGVARTSYELECLKAGTFAAESLFEFF